MVGFRWVFVGAMFMLLGGTSCKTVDSQNVAVDSELSCTQDSECTLVPVECCGCNQGGAQKAVNLATQQAIPKGGKPSCLNQYCPQVISQHESCKATAARCSAGQCVLDNG